MISGDPAAGAAEAGQHLLHAKEWHVQSKDCGVDAEFYPVRGADEAAGSVTGLLKESFEETLATHSEAVAWSSHAFHCQVANTQRFWNALLDLGE